MDNHKHDIHILDTKKEQIIAPFRSFTYSNLIKILIDQIASSLRQYKAEKDHLQSQVIFFQRSNGVN